MEMMHRFEVGMRVPDELDVWMNEGYIRNDPEIYIQNSLPRAIY